MKKFIVGFVAGALIFGGVSAYAATGLLGAKVTNVYELQDESGKKIADAPVINGKANVPVRAISEAIGRDLTVNGKVITIESATLTAEEKAALERDLSMERENVESLRGIVANYEKDIADPRMSEENAVKARKLIEDAKAALQRAEQRVAEIEAKLGINP